MALMASSLSADAWDEFQTRCLAPLEAFEAPIVDNLQTVEVANPQLLEVSGLSKYVPADATWYMYLSEGNCAIFDTEPTQVSVSKAKGWMRDVYALDLYAPDHADGSTWYSTTWRHQALEVTLMLDGVAWSDSEVGFGAYDTRPYE